MDRPAPVIIDWRAVPTGARMMPHSTIDELTRADEAFAGNRLLATFSAEARALLEPYGTMVQLSPDETVLQRGENVSSSLFPVGSTMISMGLELSGGRSIEVAS